MACAVVWVLVWFGRVRIVAMGTGWLDGVGKWYCGWARVGV